MAVMNFFQGIESFGLTGERYVGLYSNDTRNGQGTAYYSDGSTKYFGDWKDGSPGKIKKSMQKNLLSLVILRNYFKLLIKSLFKTSLNFF